jgi:hypothetical protein
MSSRWSDERLQTAQKEQIMLNAIVVLVMLSAAAPVFAEQSIAAPSRGARFGSLRPAHPDPYRKLFEPHKAAGPRAIENPRAARPRVVCGMTIVPADPKNDPAMVVLPPKTDGVDYRIRSLDPPRCNPAP